MKKKIIFISFLLFLTSLTFVFGFELFSNQPKEDSNIISPLPSFLNILNNKQVSGISLWLFSLNDSLENKNEPNISETTIEFYWYLRSWVWTHHACFSLLRKRFMRFNALCEDRYLWPAPTQKVHSGNVNSQILYNYFVCIFIWIVTALIFLNNIVNSRFWNTNFSFNNSGWNPIFM